MPGVEGLAALSLESAGGLGGSRIIRKSDAGADAPLLIFRFTTPLVVLDLGDAKFFLLVLSGSDITAARLREGVVALLLALGVNLFSFRTSAAGVFCRLRAGEGDTIASVLI
jgi:hypothetical protein